MKNKTNIVLMPSYMKEFRCTGSNCEDTCCMGWTVVIDKETYIKYKACEDAELKPIFRNMVEVKDGQRNKDFYGTIKMEKGKCPCLDENNLCKVHSKLGEEQLSITCTLYPRYLNKVDGNIEKCATMSCPAAARLALLNTDGVIFQQIEEESKDNSYINITFNSEDDVNLNTPRQHFWDLRLFCMSLLQNRNFSLDERLIIIGMVYERVIKLSEGKQYNKIPQILDQMSDIIEAEEFREQLKSIPQNNHIQMLITKELTYEKLKEGISSFRYLECLSETLLGLNCSPEDSLEDITVKYQENYKNYMQTYFNGKEYILENYLVNEFFLKLMPFGSFATIWDSYIYLCVIYSMLKLHLIGMSGYHKGLNDELVLKLIQSFSKVVLHNGKYIQNVIQLIRDNKYDSLAYMTMLVKN